MEVLEKPLKHALLLLDAELAFAKHLFKARVRACHWIVSPMLPEFLEKVKDVVESERQLLDVMLTAQRYRIISRDVSLFGKANVGDGNGLARLFRRERSFSKTPVSTLVIHRAVLSHADKREVGSRGLTPAAEGPESVRQMDEVLTVDFKGVFVDEDAPGLASDLVVRHREWSFHGEGATPLLARIPVPTVSVFDFGLCESDVDRLAADKSASVDSIAKFRREAEIVCSRERWLFCRSDGRRCEIGVRCHLCLDGGGSSCNAC